MQSVCVRASLATRWRRANRARSCDPMVATHQRRSARLQNFTQFHSTTAAIFKLLSRSSHALDACLLAGRPMPSAKDYRHYAQQCLRFADETENDEDRE